MPASPTLLGLQIFQVLFLALHDWIPLGRLNDIRAVQSADSTLKLARVTLLSTAPFAFGLAASFYYSSPPHWLRMWLWGSYGVLFLGALRAWWVPYFLTNERVRAARYEKMFGNTLAFLPMRHGIRPNALHVILHLVTLATLVALALQN
jgi:hypothetical protein